MKIATVFLGLLLGGWLLFDGVRACAVGDYVTPKSGRFAGRLGPWATLLGAVGIEPRSGPAKVLHIATGVLWLIALSGLALNTPWGRPAVTVAAVASLWYVPWGTLIAVVVMTLLVLSRR